MNKALNEYVKTGSAEAFREIVESQIDSVYSQCLRKTAQYCVGGGRYASRVCHAGAKGGEIAGQCRA